MVLIDGHDAAWLSKFQTAAEAICNNDEDLTERSVSKKRKTSVNSNTTSSNDMKERKRKLVFMHLTLSHVPWEQLPLRPRLESESDRKQQDTRKDDKQRFLAVEVIDCTGLEVGLQYIFQLPLQHLYISHSGILQEHFGRVFSKGLRDSSATLQKLHLSGANFTDLAMQGLMEGLEAATAMQELNLSYTDLGNHGNHHVDILAGNNPDNATANDIACQCLELLANGLSKSQLFCLKLNKCHLNDSQIALLVRDGISHNTNLQELYLGGNTVGAEALSALSEYLSSSMSCSLVTLGLSNALVHNPDADGDETMDSSNTTHQLSILYPALAVNTSLRVLHLASNNLRDEDMVPLCSAIAESNVTMLDLKSNRITGDGVKLLAEHMPPKLERLWLLGNPVGILGARALKDTLATSHVYLKDLRIPVYDSFELVPELAAIEKECHYYLLLNQGGRRIVLDEEQDNETHQDQSQQRPKVPQGLWPLVLERVNRVDLVLPWCRSVEYQSAENNRAEVIFYLLKNSTLFQQRHG